MAGTAVHSLADDGRKDSRDGCTSGRLGEVLHPLLDLLLPVDCGGCGVPGALLCPDCAALLGEPVQVCPPCYGALAPVYALGAYRGRLRTALLAYKERGRRDRLERRDVAGAGQDDVGVAVVVGAGPFPDAEAAGAVEHGVVHVEPVEAWLLARYDDVHVVAAAEAVVGHRQEGVGIRR